MPKFTKKPVTIEAFQWLGSNEEELKQWLLDNSVERECLINSDGTLTIKTLEGDHTAIPTDWIIQGVKGEIYPCKMDIFEATYSNGEAEKDPFQFIYDWNVKAGNLNPLEDYDHFLEVSMSIEESLEDLNLGALANSLDSDLPADISPKEMSRLIAGLATEGIEHYDVPEVALVDKHLDNIIINLGSLYKANKKITPAIAIQMLNIVVAKNMEKVINSTRDEHKKVIKPKGFVGPESQLQEVLDELNKTN